MRLIVSFLTVGQCQGLSLSHETPLTVAHQAPSFVHGILQARILEWIAISFPGALPNPGVEPRSPVLQVDSLLPEPPRQIIIGYVLI